MKEEKIKATDSKEKYDHYPSPPHTTSTSTPPYLGDDEEQQQQELLNARRPCCTSFLAISCLFGTFLILASLAVLLAISLTGSLHDPTITLSSARVLTPSQFPPSAAITTLGLDLLVCNPNGAAPFDHGPGTTLLRYRGHPLGSVQAGAGRVPAKGCEHVPCALSLGGLFAASEGKGQNTSAAGGSGGLLGMIIDDAAKHGGEVPFDAQARLQGTVRVLGVFRRKAVAAGTCHVVMKLTVAQVSVIRYTCSAATDKR